MSRKVNAMKYFRKKRMLFLIIAICLGTVGFSVLSFAQNRNTGRVNIENKTRSLIVESVNSVGDSEQNSNFEITFKSNYEKPVSAYRFRVTDESTAEDAVVAIEKNGMADDWTLKTNELSKAKFSAGIKGKITVTVAAVLFEDGTGDGEPDDLGRLQEIRTGVWMAFNRIIPILKENVAAGDSSETKLESIEEQIDQLNTQDVPDNSKRGFAFAKNNVVLSLKDVKREAQSKPDFNPVVKMAEKLNQIKSIVQKMTGKPQD
jgi:hypothetical protein